MTLIVTSPGITLRRSGICIAADGRDGIRRVPAAEVVFKLFSRYRTGFVRFLAPCEGGRCLSADGKRRLIEALEERMEGPDGEGGRGAVMRELVFSLSRRLKAHGDPEEETEAEV